MVYRYISYIRNIIMFRLRLNMRYISYIRNIIMTQTKHDIDNNVDNGRDRLLRRGNAEGGKGWRSEGGIKVA